MRLLFSSAAAAATTAAAFGPRNILVLSSNPRSGSSILAEFVASANANSAYFFEPLRYQNDYREGKDFHWKKRKLPPDRAMVAKRDIRDRPGYVKNQVCSHLPVSSTCLMDAHEIPEELAMIDGPHEQTSHRHTLFEFENQPQKIFSQTFRKWF
jgi:hypothetical protein